LQQDTLPENQKFEPAYFLKLFSALAILAIIYFGSSFFENKPESKSQNLPEASPPQTENNILAASLPLAQNAYLVPTSDIIIPIRKWSVDEPTLNAQSFYVVEINSGKVLAQKEPEKIHPVASLTKLVTALVVLERANLKDEITISQKAVETEGEMGNLIVDEKMTVESLLYAMLIESSNDAAVALAEKFDGQFIGYMNQKTAQLELKDTHFSDPSGLSTKNLSTAKDMAKIMREFIKYPLLTKITKMHEADILSTDGKHNHHLTNTNKLLAKYPEIIAGKTGFIDESGNCFIVAIQAPDNKGVIVNVILNTQDRIGEMDKLIQWAKKAFLW
jgi:D-alanyl-D-alanine carboxypeptidase (penicillin-binding protein 5/6)